MTLGSVRNPEDIARLVEQLGRRLHGRANVRGMKPAQWAALRYLAHAPLQQRTVTAFAAFNATTVSSASQTMQLLARRGLVQARALPQDSRVKSLELTGQARRLLASDPMLALTRAIAEIDGDRITGFASIVEALLRVL